LAIDRALEDSNRGAAIPVLAACRASTTMPMPSNRLSMSLAEFSA
jgi:hypothetical protein